MERHRLRRLLIIRVEGAETCVFKYDNRGYNGFCRYSDSSLVRQQIAEDPVVTLYGVTIVLPLLNNESGVSKHISIILTLVNTSTIHTHWFRTVELIEVLKGFRSQTTLTTRDCRICNFFIWITGHSLSGELGNQWLPWVLGFRYQSFSLMRWDAISPMFESALDGTLSLNKPCISRAFPLHCMLPSNHGNRALFPHILLFATWTHEHINSVGSH